MFRRSTMTAGIVAVLAAGAAFAAGTQLRFENPSGMAPPVGAYTHMAIVPAGSDLIVLAGQIGNDPAGVLPEDPVEQFRNATRNVLNALRTQGLGPEHIIKMNLWLTTELPPEKAREVRKELLGDIRPPATLAYVSRLARPDIKLEVEVWAARPPQ